MVNRMIQGEDASKIFKAMKGKSVEGGFQVGDVIQKCNMEENDHHQNGTIGVVTGGMKAPFPVTVNGHTVEACYLVDFDATGVPVFIVDYKIKKKEVS